MFEETERPWVRETDILPLLLWVEEPKRVSSLCYKERTRTTLSHLSSWVTIRGSPEAHVPSSVRFEVTDLFKEGVEKSMLTGGRDRTRTPSSPDPPPTSPTDPLHRYLHRSSWTRL